VEEGLAAVVMEAEGLGERLVVEESGEAMSVSPPAQAVAADSAPVESEVE
jgi:hypothetical protein